MTAITREHCTSRNYQPILNISLDEKDRLSALKALPNETIESTNASLRWQMDRYHMDISQKQHEEFYTNSIPNISNSIVQFVPIMENGELLIDAFQEHNPRIKPLPLEVMEFFGAKATPVSGFMRKSLYDNLDAFVKLLPEEIVLWISEAYRDPKQQMQYWLLNMASYLQNNPGSTFEEAIPHVDQMVSPIMNQKWWLMLGQNLSQNGISIEEQLKGILNIANSQELPENLKDAFITAIPIVNEAYNENPDPDQPLVIPPHTTGGAVDLFLALKMEDNTEVMLWEGKPGAMKGENPTSPTFTKDGLTDREIEIRGMVYRASLIADLINYGNEFWHYEYMTRLARRYTTHNKCAALYGMVLDIEAHNANYNLNRMKEVNKTANSYWVTSPQ